MSTGVRLVFTTVPDMTLAQTLSRQLIEAGLAACVKTGPACQSTFFWEGRIDVATEIPLMIVASTAHYAELESQIRNAHPYDIPEILAVDCSDGLPAYLQWVLAAGVDH
jgi:periplasmic divalent cation tolerance protein